MYLVSPTDRELCAELNAISDLLPESYGADILVDLKLKESVLTLAAQRKKVPDDFLASIKDGRLAKELLQIQRADIKILFLEGRFQYNKYDRVLVGKRETGFTKKQVQSMILSIQVTHGVAIEYTGSIKDTADRIREIVEWARADDHISLVKRKGPEIGDWMQKQDEVAYFYQGIGTVGYKLANLMAERFAPGDLYEASIEDLLEVPNIGRKKAKSIFDFLHRRKEVNATG